jgi:hypothetical protein
LVSIMAMSAMAMLRVGWGEAGQRVSEVAREAGRSDPAAARRGPPPPAAARRGDPEPTATPLEPESFQG